MAKYNSLVSGPLNFINYTKVMHTTFFNSDLYTRLYINHLGTHGIEDS